MKAYDYMIRATAASGSVRAFVLATTELVKEAQERHDLYPIATAALGRTMTVSLVLGAMLKGDQSVTIQIKGNGPLKGIYTTADSSGNVRGYVTHPHVDLPLNNQGKLAVGEAIGGGYLFVIRDLGLKEPYSGTVPLQTSEIGEDFAYYFANSEQTPSVVSVGVLVNPDQSCKAAGGFVLQLLPGASDELIATLEKRLPHIPPISSLIDAGKRPEEILHLLLGDLGVEIKEKTPVRFSCLCSKERFSRGLIALGAEELREMMEAENQIELVCHFCEEHYYFDRQELAALIKEIREG